MKNTGLRLIHNKSTGDVIPISAARQSREEVERAMWQRFIDAKELSQRTLNFNDARAAGKAYREFLEYSAGVR